MTPVTDEPPHAHTANRKRGRLAALLVVTFCGNAALLAGWGWAHRGEGAEAFLGVDGSNYRIVADNPFGRSQADWNMPLPAGTRARSRLAAEPGAA